MTDHLKEAERAFADLSGGAQQSTRRTVERILAYLRVVPPTGQADAVQSDPGALDPEHAELTRAALVRWAEAGWKLSEWLRFYPANPERFSRERYEVLADYMACLPPSLIPLSEAQIRDALKSGYAERDAVLFGSSPEPAPVAEPSDAQIAKVLATVTDGNVWDQYRALYQAGFNAASERKPASREGLYRHLERLLADAPIDAFLSMTGAEIKIEFTSEQKPSPPESDEVGAREAYYRRTSMRRDMAYHSVSRPLPRWSELDSGDRASELAAYRFARDIGRAERDAALRELSDARQADGETIGRLRGELAEAKAKLAEWEGMFDAIRAVISPEHRPEVKL